MQVPDKRLANLLNAHLEYRTDASHLSGDFVKVMLREEKLRTSANILANVLQIPEMALEKLCQGADNEVKENRLLYSDRGRFIIDSIKKMRK